MSSYYAQFLAAEWLRKHLEAANLEVTSLELNRSRWTENETLEQIVDKGQVDYGFSYHVNAQVQIGYRAEDVDKAANRILEAVPGARIFRRSGSIHLYGTLPGIHGHRWHIAAGQGTCERVVTGFRKVMKPAPDAPMVEVEEPIYEVICADPIFEAVGR